MRAGLYIAGGLIGAGLVIMVALMIMTPDKDSNDNYTNFIEYWFDVSQ